MWKSDYKEKGKSKKVKVRALRRPSPRALLVFCLLPFAFCLSSCRRDMQDQPKAIAYRESAFYKDGNASRLLIEGTVPRGYLRADREYYFGKKSGAPVTDRSGHRSQHDYEFRRNVSRRCRDASVSRHERYFGSRAGSLSNILLILPRAYWIW